MQGLSLVVVGSAHLQAAHAVVGAGHVYLGVLKLKVKLTLQGCLCVFLLAPSCQLLQLNVLDLLLGQEGCDALLLTLLSSLQILGCQAPANAQGLGFRV